MVDLEGFLEIKKHTYKKHTILDKYLRACMKFENKYHNFAYVDTHGGSGKVIFEGKFDKGSPLIAAEVKPSFPCHVIEIHPKRYARLNEIKEQFPNINYI